MKIIIFLHLRRKKVRKLLIITLQNKQYLNSTKFDESCLKKNSRIMQSQRNNII